MGKLLFSFREMSSLVIIYNMIFIPLILNAINDSYKKCSKFINQIFLNNKKYWTVTVLGMVCFLKNISKFSSHFRFWKKKEKEANKEEEGENI